MQGGKNSACLVIICVSSICYLCRLKALVSLFLHVNVMPTLNKTYIILYYLIKVGSAESQTRDPQNKSVSC